MTASPQDRGQIPFAQDRLETFLKARLGHEGAMTIPPVAGGQSNPTFFVDAGSRAAAYVSRCDPYRALTSLFLERGLKLAGI